MLNSQMERTLNRLSNNAIRTTPEQSTFNSSNKQYCNDLFIASQLILPYFLSHLLRQQSQHCYFKIIITNRKTSFQRILNSSMKTRQIKSPKAIKINKRISEVDYESARTKVCMPQNDEQYLSPMHIKFPKNKPRNKKQQKTCKVAVEFQEKTTKRRQRKKNVNSTNGISIINDNIQLLTTVKKDKLLNIKTKTAEKTFRNSNKHRFADKDAKCQSTDSYPLTYSKMNNSLKRSTCSNAHIPQEQYMFIGDEFYLINNYYPTKRLLNTFRQVCTQQNQQSKFLTQDKSDKLGKQKLDLKRNNIFVAARKEIQNKNKVQKIVIIQRWWRRMIFKHSLQQQKSNPEVTVIHHVSPTKNSQDSCEDFIEITPIKPYLDDFNKQDKVISPTSPPENSNKDEIEIVSFDSTEIIEYRPRKIQFKQEDISKMIGSYRLPQNGDIDSNENEAVFSNYANFRINEFDGNNHSQSEDSSQNIISPKKDDAYPSPKKQGQIDEGQPNIDLLRQFQQATIIKELIDQRIIYQKGQVKTTEKSIKVGISTSILSIHNMLINFFHFYINKYRDQFLSLINMPFGHSIPSRLKALSGQPLTQDIEQDDSGILYGLKEIIDDQKMQQYFKLLEVKQNKMNSSFAKANFELQKIHFKAVLDYFNQQLNEYRPYKQINGVPYPWNHSYKALTFFFVTQENIAQVFEKAQLKVLKSSSLLCGILIPQMNKSQEFSPQTVEQFMDHYQKDNNGVILEHNESKEVKLIHEQVKSEIFEHNFQTFSGVLLEVACEVMRQLILETVLQFPGFDFQNLIY